MLDRNNGREGNSQKQATEKLNKDLGDRLRTGRDEKGLSQKELAALVGVPAASISAYEIGKNAPTLLTLVGIARILECSLHELLTGNNWRTGNVSADHTEGLVNRVGSQLYRAGSLRTALIGRITLQIANQLTGIAETLAEDVKQGRYSPSPEIFQSDHMVELEKHSTDTWIATRDLKRDTFHNKLAVRFSDSMANNLMRHRSYRFLFPDEPDKREMCSDFREQLRIACDGSLDALTRCETKFLSGFPAVSFVLHRLDVGSLRGSGLLYETVADYIHNYDERPFRGSWIGHVVAPVERAEFVILMDLDSTLHGLSTFEKLWQQSHK